MSALIPGSAYRSMLLGQRVSRATALLPQTATGNIFAVSGGRVLITGFVGQVDVVLSGTTNTLKVTASGTDLCTAGTITSLAAGSQLMLPAAVGSALTVVNSAAGAVYMPVDSTSLLVTAGSITVTTTGSQATGTVSWALTYVPWDDGASVTAA